jgi:hypothetical protein
VKFGGSNKEEYGVRVFEKRLLSRIFVLERVEQ